MNGSKKPAVPGAQPIINPEDFPDPAAYRDALRKQAIKTAWDIASGAEGVANLYPKLTGDYEAATRQGLAAQRAGVQAGVGGALRNAGGMVAGGGNIAALSGAGQQLGREAREYTASRAGGLSQLQLGEAEAKQNVAAQRLEAQKFQAESGTAQEDEAKALSDAQTRWQEVKPGFEGGMFDNSDEDGAVRWLEEQAASSTSPAAKKFYLDKAAAIRGGGTGWGLGV